jgi:hypothetical protein
MEGDDAYESWASLDDDDYDSLARNIGINDRLVTPSAARDASSLIGRRPSWLTVDRLQRFGYAAAVTVLVAWFIELAVVFASRGPSVWLGSMFTVDVTTLARLVYKWR